VSQAIGEDNTYAGSNVVLQGWIRFGLGIAAIVVAVWSFFFGPEA
jgi:hypothetical protein